MENHKNINPTQNNHSDENEPWTPEYQKPALKEDADDKNQEIDKNEHNPIPNLNSSPSNSNEEDNDPDEEEDDDDKDSDNEVFEEDGDFEEKDNDYREDRDREGYNFNQFTLSNFF